MIRINIYLLKEDFVATFPYETDGLKITVNKKSIFDNDVCLKGEEEIKKYINKQKRSPKEVLRAKCENEVYFRNNPKYEPDWKHYWNIEEKIYQQTADAIVFATINDRKFAICHGYSSHLLNPHAIETYFGLRTAVNMINPEKINSTDIFTPSELAFKKRIKTDIGANFEDFEINTLNTLLKNISGQVKEEYKEYIKCLDAADNFKFNFSNDITKLYKTLSKLLSIFSLDTYKKTVFKYLDNFLPIKDKEKIEELDKKLIEAINKRDNKVKLFTPVDMNYSGPLSFKINQFGSNNVYSDFDIVKTLYSLLDKAKVIINDIEELKKPRLTILEEENRKNVLNNFSLYKCIYYEIFKKNIWYFLESGIWYQVDKMFSDSIESEVSELIKNYLKYDIKFNRFSLKAKHSKHKKLTNTYENWFNKDLTSYFNNIGKAICLDADNIQMDGYNKIEVFDVLYVDKKSNKYLFHNKYNYGSSALCHLFSQGNVSAELLTNPKFREKVNAKIADNDLKFKTDNSYRTRDYTVVYGIISKPNQHGKYDIPLFSKINLKIFIDSLNSKSYNFKLCFFEEE